MKTVFKKISAVALITFFFVSCSKDNTPTPTNPTGGETGTYVGNLQVSDDPQTNLGYVFNTNVTLTTSGTNATVKITGNESFDREYTGTVSAGSSAAGTIIALNKQTKPVAKTAGGTLVIINNSLTIDVNLLDDAVVVRKTTTSDKTLTIAGKIKMIGTDLLKK
jgi:hypothetical protein